MNFAGSSRSDCIALVEAFRVSPAPKAATAGVRTLHALGLSPSQVFLV